MSGAAGKMLTGEHADVVRDAVRLVLAELMEAEVGEFAGVARYERSAERVAQRNGYRNRHWDTRGGTLELEIPPCAAAATSNRHQACGAALPTRCLGGVGI